MAEQAGIVLTRKLSYDFLGNLRGEYSQQRGCVDLFHDFGAGVVAWTTLLTVGATRMRLVAVSMYSLAANTVVIADAAAQKYPTQDLSGNFVLGRNELGGGITFTTSIVVTPTANGCQIWLSYVPEADLDNE